MLDKEVFLLKSREHKQEYYKIFPEDSGFAIDGPNNCELWSSSNVKILFLLQETYGGKNDEFMCIDSLEYNKPNVEKNFYKNKTNRNIAKIANGIFEIMDGEKPSRTVGLGQKTLSKAYEKIATIELKKSTNKNSKKCNQKHLIERAKFSSAFIRWQIAYLNPTIIVCCGKITEHLLRNYIYSPNENLQHHIFSCNHPATRGYLVDSVLKEFENQKLQRDLK